MKRPRGSTDRGKGPRISVRSSKKIISNPKSGAARRGLVRRCSDWLGRTAPSTPELVSASRLPSSPGPPRGSLVPWVAVSRLYNDLFLNTHHYNLAGMDPILGPIIISVRFLPNTSFTTLLLRLPYGCFHLEVDEPPPRSCLSLAQLVCPALSLTSFSPLLLPNTSLLLSSPHLAAASLYSLLLGKQDSPSLRTSCPLLPKLMDCSPRQPVL